eukprot:TRINITY_DN1695_c0_g1_i1.p2 TRINITY_DN1695_c0_g1~~TRINITY_DN1695_c0_g1_i1.p2  ORF type:complete len:138 (-),score=44.13 TRINITY_DN1695_c0_g1_i1:164-577(-)
MANRVTYLRGKSYNTRSNGIRKVKTPGGRTTIQYVGKNPVLKTCAICPKPLAGIPSLRPHQYKFLKNRDRSVSRPYGGNLCGQCVRDRIVRAFLIEEVKIVKRVMSTKGKQQNWVANARYNDRAMLLLCCVGYSSFY